MDKKESELERVHARYAPVEVRVDELLANIRHACQKLGTESYNRANERLVEEFISGLRNEFPRRVYETTVGADKQAWERARAHATSPAVVVERQRLSPWALRTTRWNYLFTVLGESPERIILVAHYDTWRGPGADDNTTGEEILKQYLLADLRGPQRPALTHTYFLAGSEECGLIGLVSQLLLALGLVAANLALTQQQWLYVAVAVALCPLASYRFGVSGSREYVRALREDELRRIRAVVSVDSVGEGRLYIPRSTLGADFIRALIPFGDYDSLNDLLEEAAHLHAVKYNNYIAGGTTDHVSFLEVNNGLWDRALETLRRFHAFVSGRPYTPPLLIPASALVAMLPGKASPIVFGGKIHTPEDVPERVYPGPLRETLLILDYFFYRLEGGPRMREPRTPAEYHYARLYRTNSDYYLALKDAIEPNRRNLNGVYRVATTLEGKRAAARLLDTLGWGVETRLRDDVARVCGEGGTWERVPIDELELAANGTRLRFARRLRLRDRCARLYHRSVAAVERWMGRYTFLTFFAVAFLVAKIFGWGFSYAFRVSFAFQTWFFAHSWLTLPLAIALQLGVLLYLMARLIPTWIDNSYRHENRADNLGSLRRLPA